MATIEEFCENILILNRGKTVLQGNLDNIKASYPANRLKINVHVDIKEYLQKYHLIIENQAGHNYILKLQDEAIAQKLLSDLVKHQINLDKFEIMKPTLNDIFIEKVGAQNAWYFNRC